MTVLQRLAVGVVGTALAVGGMSANAQEDDRAAVGAALTTIFSPQRAPAQKTMGLVQRSFLDAAEQSSTRLELAVAVDGTESMGRDLEGVRNSIVQMIEDLRLYKGVDRVAVALVAFRDVGAPSGPAQVLLKQFTPDLDVIRRALPQLKVETGAPYFPEMVDYGVHTALTELEWSADPQTSRWLMVFTDAPPYDPDFVDTATGARRSYDTSVLVGLAKAKGIQIHTVLCGSRDEEATVYQQVVDKSRKFLNDLAAGTGGNMLDLSYPDIRKTMLEAARQERVAYQPIGHIAKSEIEAARQRAKAKVRLAILPHLKLDAITFDPARPEVQLAAELRAQLRRSERIDAVSPVDLERKVRSLAVSRLTPEQFLQALALQVRAEYVIWGELIANAQGIDVRSAVYAKDTGEKLAEAVLRQAREAQAVAQLTTRLAEEVRRRQSAAALASAIAAIEPAPASPTLTVSYEPETRSEFLTGYEALEQAVGRPLGDSEAIRLLETSHASLKAAVESEKGARNPLYHLVWANCLFNQAETLRKHGNHALAEQKKQLFLRELRLAWVHRDQTQDNRLKREIEADFQLLINRDPAKAIEQYAALTQTGESEYALRAHWMLAGIRSGDWGAAPFAAPEEARRHLIEILALWPDSPQAQLIRQSLRWNEDGGRTEFAHFPKLNEWAAR